jgi:hypothetical protein
MLILKKWDSVWTRFSVILREEPTLSVFENGVLKKIFGPKRCKVTREWKKVHNGGV